MAHRRGPSADPEAVLRLGLRRWGVVHLDAHPWAMNAWGASDGARPGAAVYALPALRPVLLDAAAQRLVCRARDDPALGGCPSVLMEHPPDARAPSRPAAARFAE